MIDHSTSSIDDILLKIKKSNLKLTNPRKHIVKLLFSKGHRHVMAEDVYMEALEANIHLSLATVYNTLNSLSKIGIIREIKVFSQSVFDTCVDDHAHILDDNTYTVRDIELNNECMNLIRQQLNISQENKIDVIVKISKP